jgi:hypothetical protein
VTDPVDLLGDTALLMAGDRSALLPAAATAGAQVRATAAALSEALPELAGTRPRAIVILADGRSAHDAAIVAALLGPECPVPVVITPALPMWVGALDVVVVLESGTPTEAAGAAVALRRGAAVIVRGASRGDVAAAVPGKVYPPGLGVPEGLAGPARVTFLLGVASALGLLHPALDETSAETIADLLDLEALACAPQTEAFVNPAVSLAQQFAGHDLVVGGMETIGVALAAHVTGVLGEMGGAVGYPVGATEFARSVALTARLGRPRDVFADPYDAPVELSPLRALVLRVTEPAEPQLARLSAAWLRSLRNALPQLLILDGPEFTLAPVGAGPSDEPPKPEPVGWVRIWASVALMMLRLDFAAVYLGIANGQIAPLDAPSGLGSPDGTRQFLRPDSVVSSFREEDVDRWN